MGLVVMGELYVREEEAVGDEEEEERQKTTKHQTNGIRPTQSARQEKQQRQQTGEKQAPDI